MSRPLYPPFRTSLPDNLEAISRIKAWTRQILSPGPGTALSVSELACAQDGCPPLETVILVLVPGERGRKYSIHKGLREVCEADVHTCIAGPYIML